jgi:hypothetical protein
MPVAFRSIALGMGQPEDKAVEQSQQGSASQQKSGRHVGPSEPGQSSLGNEEGELLRFIGVDDEENAEGTAKVYHQETETGSVIPPFAPLPCLGMAAFRSVQLRDRGRSSTSPAKAVEAGRG